MIEKLSIRERAEAKEESWLSTFAVKSWLSRGRHNAEPPCHIRTAFQRDKDRIIYSNAFRRLKHKTQVFIAPQGDHFVTRLTHTLEVAQIARTISRALNLNEDLTEAIALGHDLGHTPFGHTGEKVLNELFPGGFHHNKQSLRVVEKLEKSGKGLNLTWEVRDGILTHSKTSEKKLKGSGKSGTLEGSIVRIADVIAYVNHDIEDAIRAGILTEADLPVPATAVLGRSHGERIDSLVSDIIRQSWGVADGTAAEPAIKMSDEVLQATNVMRDFLFERVYNLEAARAETIKAQNAIRRLYEYYNKHEDKLPAEYRMSADETARRVVDYIAGMTDQFALRAASQI